MKYSRLKPEHKVILDSSLTQLEQKASEMSRADRIQAIEELTECYTIQMNYRLDSHTLTRMANLILYEELSDPRKNKMSITEYPILSTSQYERRTEGKRKRQAGAYREVPVEHATNVATDGRNYTLPIRSFNNFQQ